MPRTPICPVCGRTSTVPPRARAERLSCRHCSSVFLNPAIRSEFTFADEATAGQPARWRKAKRLSPRVVGAGLGSSTVLLLAVLVGWLYHQSGDARDNMPRHRPTPLVEVGTPPAPTPTSRDAVRPAPDNSPPAAAPEQGNVSPGVAPDAAGVPAPPVREAAAPRLPSGVSILLPRKTLATLRNLAAANAPRWKAFKSRLDATLPQIIQGSYQGDHLTWISDYSLGYQILKDRDPATASRYADKAIALIKSGLRDYQKGGWVARQLLARGDGMTRSYKLPHRHVIHSSMRVYLGTVSSVAVKHGSAHGADPVGYYYQFLKVSDTPDGRPSYKEGADWRRSRDLPNNVIDWSLSGKAPAPGATYHVTVTSGATLTSTPFILKGNTLTLANPPRKDQAVFVEYVYGKHARDHSALAYQQTSAGDGGFSSILVDTSYTSRYLGKHIAMGLDWLDGYPGLSRDLRNEAIGLLVRWSDHVRDHGYMKGSPASNYEAGAYVSRVMTALVLARRHPAGPRLLAEILTYRRKHVLPILENQTRSLKGGFWSEGWNYGALAAQNLLLAGLALEGRGATSAAAERRWASEVILHLVSAQSSRDTVYDGGDWYGYPAPFPGKDLFYVLAAAAEDSDAQAYANYVLQKYPGSTPANYLNLIFHNPSAPASFWSSLPLQQYASGTGLLTARSDWGRFPTWVAFQMGNLLDADHQSFSPGQLQIKRGADDLLINANAPGNNQTHQHKSTFGNVLVIDDGGEKKQNYRYCMGTWYGSPGVVVDAYQAQRDFVYLSGNYRAAYSLNTDPGGGGPARELTRQVVYLRPSHIVVYDRVTTLKPSYAKQLRWHFLRPPRVDGNSFVVTAGRSRLFGQTFSSVPLRTTAGGVKVGGATVQQLITQPSAPVTRVRYVTALQVVPSTAGRNDPPRHVVSKGERMEGIQVGGRLVLFGREGRVAASDTITYQTTGSGKVRHLLVDLPPEAVYRVKAGDSVREAVVSRERILSFTTSGAGTQPVEVVPVR